MTLGAILLLARLLSPSEAEQLGNRLIRRQLASTALDAPLRSLLPALTIGTEFQDAWSINAPPQRRRLNVFVIDSHTLPVDSLRSRIRLRGVCAFIGHPQIVVIDRAYVTELMTTLGFGASDEERLRLTLLWILGHELGHILQGHAPSHFGPQAMTRLDDRGAESRRKESAADAFVVRQTRDVEELALALDGLLINLINYDIERRTGPVTDMGVGFHYSPGRAIPYKEVGSHPEYLVRAVRMLRQRGGQGYGSLGIMVEEMSKNMKLVDEQLD